MPSPSLKLGAFVSLFVSVSVGTFFSGVPRRLGFYRWLGNLDPRFRGFSPAFLDGVPNLYSYDKLQRRTDLTGLTAIVTGANSGIGYWASRHLAAQGADVVMACRHSGRCDSAAARITADLGSIGGRAHPGGSVTTMDLDTSSPASVRSFADRYTTKRPGPLDMLVLNAGIGVSPEEGDTTADGIDLIFATNHVGHQLLYGLLLSQILESGEKTVSGGKVVLTSSLAHYDSPRWGVGLSKSQINGAGITYHYRQSKLAQILFAQEATRRLDLMGTRASSNVFVNSFNPGVVDTNIWTEVKRSVSKIRCFGWILEAGLKFWHENFMFTPEEGALTLLYLAADPSVSRDRIRGKYFHPQAVETEPHSVTRNETLQIALWDFTESLIVES